LPNFLCCIYQEAWVLSEKWGFRAFAGDLKKSEKKR